MEHRIQRAGVALLGGLVALGLVSSTAVADSRPRVPTIAPRAGACTDSQGITVVVDATAFGDGVQVRCAPQPVRSGYEALTRAGFTFEGTTQFPGLLCRIDGEPTSDPCHGAPPANAYWAYWHAPRGGSWTYSTSGAGSRVPPPGSVEGWAFGDDAAPGVDPPEPRPAPTTTRPSTTTTRAPGSFADGGSAAPSDGSPGSTPAPTDAGPDASTTSTTSDGPRTTTSEEKADRRADTDDRDGFAAGVPDGGGGGDGGSPVGALVGTGGALALGAAGVVAARRRRALDEELA